MKMFNKLAIKQFFQEIFGYTVLVYWEGKVVTHYSWNREDALEWMACYNVGMRKAMFQCMKLITTQG